MTTRQFNINQINYDDPDVWRLLQSGHTLGVFQCESKLVQHWLKKIKPVNLWELSAVISLVRPGPLNGGFCEEYIAYKNNEKDFESFGDERIDAIFESTHHSMIYQEQLMALGTRLAWAHLDDTNKKLKVDELRKSASKKDQAKILKIGKEFVEGCLHNGVDPEVANRLFEIIKGCGRYLFNLSHSFSYAKIAYKTAYFKTHAAPAFYTTYLSYAKFKQTIRRQGKEVNSKWIEIKNLCNEARQFGLKIVGPNINTHNEHFLVIPDGVQYGLSHIKYFGNKTHEKISKLIPILDWRQVILLGFTDDFGFKLNKNTMEALIVTGCFQDTKISRTSLLNMVNCLERLTDKEIKLLLGEILLKESPKISELPTFLVRVADKTMKKREEIVLAEASLLKVDTYDDPAWVEQVEKDYLGIALSASAVDDKVSDCQDSCSDIVDEVPTWQRLSVAATIDDVKMTITKNGKNPGQKMCFISISDSTGSVERLPVFPDKFMLFEEFLIPKTTAALTLLKGKGGWFVESMYEI